MHMWTKQLDEDVHDACAAILSLGIAFRHQYLERAELGKAMLERVPNIFKRERRRDVIEKGTRSQHFIIAVQRMLQLLDEMEEALTEHRWLGCEEYTLADVAFTPYLARLEHLNIFGMVRDRSRGAEWDGRCNALPSFEAGIKKWENPGSIELIKTSAAENLPHRRTTMASRQHTAGASKKIAIEMTSAEAAACWAGVTGLIGGASGVGVEDSWAPDRWAPAWWAKEAGGPGVWVRA